MKRLMILLLSIFSLVPITGFSQEIILTFNPVDPLAVIDSVITYNQSTQSTSSVTGNVVTLDITTNVNNFENVQGELLIYPNPFYGNTNFVFNSPLEEKVTITITDLLGQLIFKQEQKVFMGTNRCEFSLKSKGLLLVNVIGKINQFSAKMVNLSTGSENNKLSFSSEDQNNNPLKSANDDFINHFLIDVFSGNNITRIADNPTESKTYEVEFFPCTDFDENNYKVVKIGNQWWMAENLKTTKFNNGDSLAQVSDSVAWNNLITSAYCWYNNDSDNLFETYGALYNWYSIIPDANNGKNLCPVGWHVSTDSEWHTLVKFLDPGAILQLTESLIAGDKLKESGNSHWIEPNEYATNESGFTALPAGSRYFDLGFSNFGNMAFFWCAPNSDDNDDVAIYRRLHTLYSDINWCQPSGKNRGQSVRCVKD